MKENIEGDPEVTPAFSTDFLITLIKFLPLSP